MAGQLDLFMLEKQAGTQFANRIKRNLVSSIRSKTNKGSGLALKSTVKPFYKNNLLERITIFTPYYIYPILHVGFEGTKSNGINARLKARDFIIDARAWKSSRRFSRHHRKPKSRSNYKPNQLRI